MRIIKIVLVLLLVNLQLIAQNSIKILTEKKGISLRGMSIPSEKVVWASGSKGTVVKSVNGGESFEWIQVKDYENRDFRAIHAWNENEVLIVAVAAPAVILKSLDGGMNWYKVYENADTSMFLDAVAFKDDNVGAVIGDPINDTIFLLDTKDKGEHWEKVKSSFWKSKVQEGEAFFASSNSNLLYLNNEIIFISGGMKSRLWINGMAMDLPITQGLKSTGANSISIAPNLNQLAIAGGDFSNPNNKEKSFVKLNRFKYPNSDYKHLSETKYFWKINKKANNLNGYKSSVIFLNNKWILAAGTSGVDLSINKAKNWEKISNESFHVVQRQPNRKAAFFAGSGGRIGYLSFQ
ncbi:MAG: hypothetical protein RLZ95_1224 [Bacteroidota bacterium]|jgi:photosystem II stability/assembly factor-like uncharacterized protein